MKPFDLEAAKRGERVMTRDGRDVRIVCFDMKGKDDCILALITIHEDGEDCERSLYFYSDGRYYEEGRESDNDLFMWSPRHERWVLFDYDQKLIINNEILRSKEEAEKYAANLGLSRYSTVLVGQWYDD